jgi:hypothetical protein
VAPALLSAQTFDHAPYPEVIQGGFPVELYSYIDRPNVHISAWHWPDAPNPYEVGAISQDVLLSNLTYVNPTLSTFTASVSGAAQPGEHLFFELSSYTGTQLFWNVSIQSPPAGGPCLKTNN